MKELEIYISIYFAVLAVTFCCDNDVALLIVRLLPTAVVDHSDSFLYINLMATFHCLYRDLHFVNSTFTKKLSAPRT